MSDELLVSLIKDCISTFKNGVEFLNITKLSKLIDYKGELPLKEFAYCKLNNTEPKICSCGNRVKFISFNLGYRDFCSKRCCALDPDRQKKATDTCIKRYNVSKPLQNPDILQKTKESLFKNYGVTNPQHSNEIKLKTSATCIEKYGSASPLKSEDIKQKIKNTCIEKYGVEHAICSSEIKQKIRESNLINFGTPTPLQNPDILQKTKESLFKNYGVNVPFRSDVIKERFIQSCIERYNVSHISQRNIDNIENLNEEFIHQSFVNNNKFNKVAADNYFNVSHTFFYKNAAKFNLEFIGGVSYPELELREIVPSICNDRSLIKPLEIDILSHDYKFGIEYNGLMFHSYGKSKTFKFDNSSREDRVRHLTKTNLVESKGYQLFHIFENEWIDPKKKQIWISMLNSKMNKTEKIYARKCEVKLLNSKPANEFLKLNHIQGSSTGINIGLLYNDELVSVMTFGKSRFNKQYEYELLRFCNKLNTTVVGGFSKLIKFFEVNYKPKSLVSYANRRWSVGNVYEKNGFIFSHDSNPNFFYFKDGSLELESRNKYQKHNLHKLLAHFDESLTESENMFNNGYRRIWDCGNKVYYKEYK